MPSLTSPDNLATDNETVGHQWIKQLHPLQIISHALMHASGQVSHCVIASLHHRNRTSKIIWGSEQVMETKLQWVWSWHNMGGRQMGQVSIPRYLNQSTACQVEVDKVKVLTLDATMTPWVPRYSSGGVLFFHCFIAWLAIGRGLNSTDFV